MFKPATILLLAAILIYAGPPAAAEEGDANERLLQLADRWGVRLEGAATRFDSKLEQLRANGELGLPAQTPNISPTSSVSASDRAAELTRYLRYAIEAEIATLPPNIRGELEGIAETLAGGFSESSRTDAHRTDAAGHLQTLQQAADKPAVVLLRPLAAFVCEDWKSWRASSRRIDKTLIGRHPFLLTCVAQVASHAAQKSGVAHLPVEVADRLRPLFVEGLSISQEGFDADFPMRTLHLRDQYSTMLRRFSPLDRVAFFEAATDEVLSRNLPDHPLASLIAAANDTAGWEERGQGFIQTIDGASLTKFEAHMQAARDFVQLSFLDQPNDVTNAFEAIRLETYIGMPGTAAEWYSIGSTIERDSYNLAHVYTWSCTPRWGGDARDLVRFGEALIAADDAGPEGSLWCMTAVLETLRSIYYLQTAPRGPDARRQDGLRTSLRFRTFRPMPDFAPYDSLLGQFATAASRAAKPDRVSRLRRDELTQLAEQLVLQSQLKPLGELAHAGLFDDQSDQLRQRYRRRGLPALTPAVDEVTAIQAMCSPYATEFTPDTPETISALVDAARSKLAKADLADEVAAETEAFLTDAELVVSETRDFFSGKPGYGIVVPFDDSGNCGLIASPINVDQVRVEPDPRDERWRWFTFEPRVSGYPFGVRVDLPLPGPVSIQASVRVDDPPAEGQNFPLGIWVGPDDVGGVLHAVGTQMTFVKFERLPLNDPEGVGQSSARASLFSLPNPDVHRLHLRTSGPKMRVLINEYELPVAPALLDPPSDHRPLFIGSYANPAPDMRLGVCAIVIVPDQEAATAGPQPAAEPASD